MPELPEVETTRRGVGSLLRGGIVSGVMVRDPRLRRPVPADLGTILDGQRLAEVTRRGKYLLYRFAHGTLIVHLGMSGSLRILPANTPPRAHDHVDLEFDGTRLMRLRDPRRFGLMLWTTEPPARHPLLATLGPEPWDDAFSAAYLRALAVRRRAAVKSMLMDAQVVVGVGNIYASEALHRAGIHPLRAANRVSGARYARLVAAVREVLEEAIGYGGTTLRDFTRDDGRPGYFRNELRVYGRAGEGCTSCGRGPVAQRVIGGRSSFFCPHCQR